MWFYAFIPVLVTLVGSAWTAWHKPTPKVIGAIQHFAAGVVFYAALGEILPNATHEGSVWTIVLGGGLGIVAMLSLRYLTEGKDQGPTGLIVISALDALVDGLVLGLAFNAGSSKAYCWPSRSPSSSCHGAVDRRRVR